jgi:hypothetical protein
MCLFEFIRMKGVTAFMRLLKEGATYQSLGTCGLEKESFASAGDRTPVTQPVVRHYTELLEGGRS